MKRCILNLTNIGFGRNWIDVMFGALFYMAQRPGANVFGELRNVLKWSEKVTNEEFIEHIDEKRALLNNILSKKAYWVGRILRRNYLLHYAIEG